MPGIALGVLSGWLIATTAPATEPSFEQLLESTDLVLQTQWAQRYEHGEGLERNYDRAIQLYCSAAWDGDVYAQYQLGWMYANGRGLERNDHLASGWFALAAAQGDGHASRMLAHLGSSETGETARCLRPNGEEVLRLPIGNSPKDIELTTRLVKRLAPPLRIGARAGLGSDRDRVQFRSQRALPKRRSGVDAVNTIYRATFWGRGHQTPVAKTCTAGWLI